MRHTRPWFRFGLVPVCVVAALAVSGGSASAGFFGSVRYLVNGDDPEPDALIRQPVAPGGEFVLTEISCGDEAHPPIQAYLFDYPGFGTAAVGSVDEPSASGLIEVPTDTTPGEYRLIVQCETDTPGVLQAYSSRVFVASTAYFEVAHDTALAGESIRATEATCGASSGPPARYDLTDSAGETLVTIDPVNLDAFSTAVPIPRDIASGRLTVSLSCAGSTASQFSRTVTIRAPASESPVPAAAPTVASPMVASPTFTG